MEANVADRQLERMGLRVINNTLEADWNSTAELEDVKGQVEIQILEKCFLQPDIIEMVAGYLADEAVADRMDGSIVVEIWHLRRDGDLLILTPGDSKGRDERVPSRRQPVGFQNSPTDLHGFGR